MKKTRIFSFLLYFQLSFLGTLVVTSSLVLSQSCKEERATSGDQSERGLTRTRGLSLPPHEEQEEVGKKAVSCAKAWPQSPHPFPMRQTPLYKATLRRVWDPPVSDGRCSTGTWRLKLSIHLCGLRKGRRGEGLEGHPSWWRRTRPRRCRPHPIFVLASSLKNSKTHTLTRRRYSVTP